MSNFSKQDHATKWIPVREISVVWATAQRGYDERKAKSFADALDPDVFGVVTVARVNGDNTYHCIDGQHRVGAVRMALGDDQLVPCNVISSVTDAASAAAVFDTINSARSSPSAVDRFRVRVTAGRETEVAVNAIFTALGYRAAIGSEDGYIRAVATCCSIYKRQGGDVLRDTLATIKQAWGRASEAVDANIIAGIAAFLAEYGSKIDRKRLAEKLAKAYTPGRLIGAAKAGRDMFNGKTSETMSRLLVNAYNTGLRSGRLGEAEAA